MTEATTILTRAATEPQGWCAGGHRRILAVGTLKRIKDYATLVTNQFNHHKS